MRLRVVEGGQEEATAAGGLSVLGASGCSTQIEAVVCVVVGGVDVLLLVNGAEGVGYSEFLEEKGRLLRKEGIRSLSGGWR